MNEKSKNQKQKKRNTYLPLCQSDFIDCVYRQAKQTGEQQTDRESNRQTTGGDPSKCNKTIQVKLLIFGFVFFGQEFEIFNFKKVSQPTFFFPPFGSHQPASQQGKRKQEN